MEITDPQAISHPGTRHKILQPAYTYTHLLTFGALGKARFLDTRFNDSLLTNGDTVKRKPKPQTVKRVDNIKKTAPQKDCKTITNTDLVFYPFLCVDVEFFQGCGQPRLLFGAHFLRSLQFKIQPLLQGLKQGLVQVLLFRETVFDSSQLSCLEIKEFLVVRLCLLCLCSSCGLKRSIGGIYSLTRLKTTNRKRNATFFMYCA